MKLRALVMTVLLVLPAGLAACGGGGSSHEDWPAPVQEALHGLDEMGEANDAGDWEAVGAAFRAYRPSFVEAAELVKPVDEDLSAEIDGMTIHLESHFDMEPNFEHLKGVFKDFRALLEQAGEALAAP